MSAEDSNAVDLAHLVGQAKELIEQTRERIHQIELCLGANGTPGPQNVGLFAEGKNHLSFRPLSPRPCGSRARFTESERSYSA